MAKTLSLCATLTTVASYTFFYNEWIRLKHISMRAVSNSVYIDIYDNLLGPASSQGKVLGGLVASYMREITDT
jgi:hypothetical protein